MPQYHIIRRLRKKSTDFESCCIISAAGIRSAFAAFKKTCKKEPEKYKLETNYEYHIYPINHCRFWNFKRGKWSIDSFYGNHNQKKYQKEQQIRLTRLHEGRQKIKNATTTQHLEQK